MKEFTRKCLYDIQINVIAEKHLNCQTNSLTESFAKPTALQSSLPRLTNHQSSDRCFYFDSIKKSIFKISVPPNLKFCFTEISWRKKKTMRNCKMTLEEMNKLHCYIFSLKEFLRSKGRLWPGTGRLQLIKACYLSVLMCPRKSFKTLKMRKSLL